MALLAQVPAFNGLGSTKFEDWIQHFERVMDTSEFEEGRKIKMLCSKLFGTAGDCFSTFQSTLDSCSVNTRLFSRSGVGSLLLELSLSSSFSVVKLSLVMQAR
jgi:hypothetical protein